MENAFPKDITDSMRTCILSLFWKKDDIVAFFKNNSCTASDLKDIQDTSDLSRSKIVDDVFNKLHGRNDGGLGQFRSMLQSLIDWKSFDPYYFDILKKLDKESAQRNINHLKQLQEIRDAKLSEEKRKREEKTEALKKKIIKKKSKKCFFNFYKEKMRIISL